MVFHADVKGASSCTSSLVIMINTHHNNFVVQIQREDEQKDAVYLLPIALGQTLQDWEIYPASSSY